MNNILQKVIINGLWGTKNIEIDFEPDINFLIGVNGSGKTTIINTIAAALSGDFISLDRLPFEKITLQLTSGSKRPIIEIHKKMTEHSSFASITYKIKDKSSSKAIAYSLDEFEGQIKLRHYPPGYYQRQLRQKSAGIMEHLKKLVNSNWLSIHRTNSFQNMTEERSNEFESTIDKKLVALSNEFVKYFSFLSKKASVETSKFQKTVFLSLLVVGQTEDQLFSAIKKLDLALEEKALTEIFREFKVGESMISKSVTDHFDILKSAVERIEKKEAVTSNQLAAIVVALRTHSVVTEWNKLLDEIKNIYEPRDAFLRIINAMMKPKKELIINDKNELTAQTQTNKNLALKYLSSGEKQLLIILGEALLQERKPWVYIADEPELSLHINWQEHLIENIRNINPNAQILFATHSPDIVSSFEKKVIDVEKLIS